MSGMVHAAIAGDIAEAEEMQEILRNAGIDTALFCATVGFVPQR